VQDPTGIETTISTFSQEFNEAQLKYSVGEQDTLAAHTSCRKYHDIIYGCEVIIRSDHMNITRASTKHTNFRVSRQIIETDQVYSVKFKHLLGELNTATDGLSGLEMRDGMPSDLLDEIHVIDKLNRDVNPDFPLAMSTIQDAQATDPKLQELLTKERYKNNFGHLSFGNTKEHTFDGKNKGSSNSSVPDHRLVSY
jgi:hypothetical protein